MRIWVGTFEYEIAKHVFPVFAVLNMRFSLFLTTNLFKSYCATELTKDNANLCINKFFFKFYSDRSKA